MGMTARLGLKRCRPGNVVGSYLSRNGDDSPLGIETLPSLSAWTTWHGRNGDDSPLGIETCIVIHEKQWHVEVEMGMTARLGLKRLFKDDPGKPYMGRNGDDSPLGIETFSFSFA